MNDPYFDNLRHTFKEAVTKISAFQVSFLHHWYITLIIILNMQNRAAQTREIVRAFRPSHDRRRKEFEAKMTGMSIVYTLLVYDYTEHIIYNIF